MSESKRCTSCGNALVGGYHVDRPCCGGAMCVGCCDVRFGTFVQGGHYTCRKCPWTSAEEAERVPCGPEVTP